MPKSIHQIDANIKILKDRCCLHDCSHIGFPMLTKSTVIMINTEKMSLERKDLKDIEYVIKIMVNDVFPFIFININLISAMLSK